MRCSGLELPGLVCAGLGRLRFGVPKPGLEIPRSVLDMGLSDHRLSAQEHVVPGIVVDLWFTRFCLGGPGSVLDLESTRLGGLCGVGNGAGMWNLMGGGSWGEGPWGCFEKIIGCIFVLY